MLAYMPCHQPFASLALSSKAGQLHVLAHHSQQLVQDTLYLLGSLRSSVGTPGLRLLRHMVALQAHKAAVSVTYLWCGGSQGRCAREFGSGLTIERCGVVCLALGGVSRALRLCSRVGVSMVVGLCPVVLRLSSIWNGKMGDSAMSWPPGGWAGVMGDTAASSMSAVVVPASIVGRDRGATSVAATGLPSSLRQGRMGLRFRTPSRAPGCLSQAEELRLEVGGGLPHLTLSKPHDARIRGMISRSRVFTLKSRLRENT